MAKEALLRQLDELHRELQSIKEVEPTALESLQRVAEDIRGLVERSSAGESLVAAESQSVREQIEQLESEHPIVTRVLSQMTDFLAMLGI